MEKTSLLLNDFSSVVHPNVFQLYKLIRSFHITLYIYHHNFLSFLLFSVCMYVMYKL